MKRFRFAALLLLAAGCAAPASDAVLLKGAALDTLPDAWFSWRNEPARFVGKGLPADFVDGRTGLLVYADGRAEAVSKSSPMFAQSFGGGTRRRSGVLSAADRAELEKAATGPIAAPVRPERKLKEGCGPETEGGSRYIVEIRGAGGAVRRVSYDHQISNGESSGGEPLHPLVMRILKGLQE